MTVERSQVGCRLWLQWILASTVGLLVGVAMGLFLAEVLTIPLDWKTERVVGHLIVVGMIGAISGLTQLFVLEEHIPRAGWWILATAAAWILVWGLIPVEIDVRYIFGVLTGILQWLILRRHVPRASLWVLASAVGWALGHISVEGALEGIKEDATAISLLLAQVSLVSSVITGGTLVWLLRQSAPES